MEPTNCRHYWIIEEPQSEYSTGICKYCGMSRRFKNSIYAGGLDGIREVQEPISLERLSSYYV